MTEILACALAVAPIHRDPDAASEQVTQALRGEPLTVEERRDGWARVRTAYDYPGWVRAEAALGGEPTDWPPAVSRRRAGRGGACLPRHAVQWGGMSERGIDCSGLVHMAYRRLGRIVPRDADQQEDAGCGGRGRRRAARRPRHVRLRGGRRATHIAFWLGDGRILHATDRDDGPHAVTAEDEPAAYRARRRRFVRL